MVKNTSQHTTMFTDLRLYYIDDNNNVPVHAFIPLIDKCTQTLFPVKKEHSLVRNIYGHCVSLHSLPFKYGSIITGQGLCPPSSEILRPGAHLTVHCIQPLYTLSVQGPKIITLARPYVSNSVFLIENDHTAPLLLKERSQKSIEVPEGSQGFISYCPILSMTLISFETKFIEDQGECVQWSLTLEEKWEEPILATATHIPTL